MRVLIGAVLLMNVQSAVSFFLIPERYAPAYELIGVPGEAAIQGFGILFLMWNVPYVLAMIHPINFRISLAEAITMQTIGFFGEALIYARLPAENLILENSILRFILFDGGGLVALLIAFLMTRKIKIAVQRS